MSDETTQPSQTNTDEPKTADQGGTSKGSGYGNLAPEPSKTDAGTISKGNAGSFGAAS